MLSPRIGFFCLPEVLFWLASWAGSLQVAPCSTAKSDRVPANQHLFCDKVPRFILIGPAWVMCPYKPIAVKKGAGLCWLSRSGSWIPLQVRQDGSPCKVQGRVSPEQVESMPGEQISPDNLWGPSDPNTTEVWETLVSPDTFPEEVLYTWFLHG